MIKDECFLCEEKIYSKNLCKKHYTRAYRLSKGNSMDLAVDLLIYKEAIERAHEAWQEQFLTGDS
jgi:hypothetical protein